MIKWEDWKHWFKNGLLIQHLWHRCSKKNCLIDYNIMKDLGMNPSRKSTHYLITMTTFAHHSLAETWNFVAFVTGTQVFTCAMNFKLCQIYWKKKIYRKAFPQLQEAVLVQNVPFCLPLQPSVPPCRERLTSPSVPCPALTEGTLQGKPLLQKPSTKEKQEQNHHLCSAPLPRPTVSFQSGGDWG